MEASRSYLSFQAIALLAVSLRDLDAPVSPRELAGQLRRTPTQVEHMLEEAEAARVVTPTGAEWVLTAAGRRLASAAAANIQDARSRAPDVYRPYTDYIPEHWWPDD